MSFAYTMIFAGNEFLKNKINFLPKMINHCEIQVLTILVCAPYSKKYANHDLKIKKVH
jgi:hypothetical protein